MPCPIAVRAARFFLVACVTVLAPRMSQPAGAKEGHLEDVKFALLETRIACTTCHADAAGKDLTPYGQRLAELGAKTTLQERVRELERRPSEATMKVDADGERRRTDIDGDGVLNWVEILAGTNPSDGNDKPADGDRITARARIEVVVNCGLCHASNDPKPVGTDKAPHNALGDALEALGKPAGAAAAPATPPPFMTRFEQIENLDTDKDKARNWHELATFHSPTDASDTPSADELRQIKELLKSVKKPDVGFGRIHRPKGP